MHKQTTEKPAKPAVLNEIATTQSGRDITRGYIDALAYIQPTDCILRLRSSNYELYEEVLRDDQVHAVFSQRRLAVVSRPVKVTPAVISA